MKRDFKDLKLQLGDINLGIQISSIGPSSLCTSTESTGKLFEAFNDNVNKQAGKIFCNSLNGNLAKFPTSYEDFQSLLDYKTQLMSALDIKSLATPVSAKSYSIKPERPNIGYPDGRYLKIYELITETPI